MRILWVKIGGLWPTNTGGRLRSFNILQELAREHEISVFIFPEGSSVSELGSHSDVQRKQTFNVETWAQGGLRYVVFGDTSAEDIQKLSALLKSAQG